MPRYCDHDMVVIMEAGANHSYATIVCHYCGQVKHIYEDGSIHIIKDEGSVTKRYDEQQGK